MGVVDFAPLLRIATVLKDCGAISIGHILTQAIVLALATQ
jgi:hypothetical protein